MSTSFNPGQRIKTVRCDDDTLSVDLIDGRTITVSLAWYPRLLHATPEQRARWQISGAGYGIHWPDIDEDLSTEGLLRGVPAPASLPEHKRPWSAAGAASLGGNSDQSWSALSAAAVMASFIGGTF